MLKSGKRAIKRNEANYPQRKSLRLVKDASAQLSWREQKDSSSRRENED